MNTKKEPGVRASRDVTLAVLAAAAAFTIKDQVVWWEAGAQPPQMLADGEVVFVAFATTGESLAAVARRIFYGPARRSGEPLVTTHLATGVEMAPHLPTSPENIARALRNDWEFWVDNQDALNERFSAWLTR